MPFLTNTDLAFNSNAVRTLYNALKTSILFASKNVLEVFVVKSETGLFLQSRRQVSFISILTLSLSLQRRISVMVDALFYRDSPLFLLLNARLSGLKKLMAS